MPEKRPWCPMCCKFVSPAKVKDGRHTYCGGSISWEALDPYIDLLGKVVKGEE